MIPKNYIVIFEDGTKSEEFAYSPAEACEQALLIWGQYNNGEIKQPPKIVSIRPADELGVQRIQSKILFKYIENMTDQLKEMSK